MHFASSNLSVFVAIFFLNLSLKFSHFSDFFELLRFEKALIFTMNEISCSKDLMVDSLANLASEFTSAHMNVMAFKSTDDIESALKYVRETNPADLFPANLLRNLASEHKLATYLCGLMCAYVINVESAISSTVLFFAYAKSIQIIQLGGLYQKELQLLQEHLIAHIHFLNDEECLRLLSKMFNESWEKSLTETTPALNVTLELAVRFSQRSSNPVLRDKVHEHLMNFSGGKWPEFAVLILVAAAVECSDSVRECESVLERVRECALWSKSLIYGKTGFDLESVPTLLYHIMSLCRKEQVSSEKLVSKVVDLLAHSTDSLLNLQDCGHLQTKVGTRTDILRFRDYSTSNSTDVSSTFDLIQNTAYRIPSVLATMVHHMSLFITKDQGLMEELLKRARNRNFGIENTPHVSPSVLMMCMLAASAPRHGDAMLRALSDVISVSFDFELRFSTLTAHQAGSSAGHWFRFCSDELLQQGAAMKLCDAFEHLPRSPLMAECLASPLLRLSVMLLVIPSSLHMEASTRLSSKIHIRSHPCLTSGFEENHTVNSAFDTPASLGARIMAQLFCACPYARRSIARELLQLLSTSDLNSSQSLKCSSMTFPAVLILSFLCQHCPIGLLEVQAELNDIFACIGDYNSHLAVGVVSALTPLFQLCTPLLDRCMLAVRKCSFSRNAESRKVSAVIWLELLRFKLSVEQATLSGMVNSTDASSSFMRHSSMSTFPPRTENEAAEHMTTFSIEETLALVKRFLQHASDKDFIITRLYRLQKDFSNVRLAVLQLLSSHLQCLMCAVGVGEAAGQYMKPGYAAPTDDCIEMLNLDSCQRGAKWMVHLLCTIVAIAKSVLEDAVDSRYPSSSADNHEEEARLSDSLPAFISKVNEAEKHEAIDACQRVWRMCMSCAKLEVSDFLPEYRAEDLTDVDLHVSRAMCFLDVLMSLDVVIFGLPTISEVGLTLSQESRMHTCADILHRAQDIRTSLRQLQRKNQKAGKLTNQTRAVADESMQPLHMVHMRLRFAAVALGALYLADHDSNNNYNDNNIALSEESRLLVTRAALEAALSAMDSLSDMTTRACAYRIAHKWVPKKDTLECLGYVEPSILDAAVMEMPPLALVLLRFLSVLSSNEPSAKAAQRLIGAGAYPHLDQAQLSLRCILAVNRFALDVTAVLGTTCVPASPMKERAMRTADFVLNRALKIAIRKHADATALLEEDMRLTNSALTGTAFLSTLQTQRDLAEVRGSYGSIVKAFSRGIMNMFWQPLAQYDGTQDRTAVRSALLTGAERLCVSFAAVADLIAPMTFEHREAVINKCLRDCEEKLEIPTSTLAIVLIETIVLAVPETPSQRYAACLRVSHDVENCAKRCDTFFAEMDAEAADLTSKENLEAVDRATRVGYLSFTIIPHAITCLLGLMERALADVIAMLQLRDKCAKSSSKRRLGETDKADIEAMSSDVSDNSEQSTRNPLGELDASLHEALRCLMEAAKPLLTPYAGSASEKLLSFIVKLFRLQARLHRGLVAENLPASFFRLLQSSSSLTQPAGAFISALQNEGILTCKGKSMSSGTASKKRDNAVTRQAKIVPELVYQLEQAEVSLVRLSAQNKEIAQKLSSFIKPSALRDFKLIATDSADENIANKRARK